MPQREPIEFEPDDDAKPAKPDTQARKPKRQPIVPPLSAREPFWWAGASTILMVVAFAFVLLASGG